MSSIEAREIECSTCRENIIMPWAAYGHICWEMLAYKERRPNETYKEAYKRVSEEQKRKRLKMIHSEL